MFGSNRFLDFVHCFISSILKKKTHLETWVCFHPQVKGREVTIQFGPSERANLNLGFF
jgi:hypothetical protein